MREITDQEAATRYGITTHHEDMNNERRFRLTKSDGTAYVRTEAGAGGWQRSHYHRNIRETYIVQEGWMAHARLNEGKREISVYRSGELFTTQPNFVHNVYLPAGAVIHTVKHGAAAGQDRVEDETTERFDEMTRGLTEEQIEREAGMMANGKPDEIYTAEYRHLDTLIWQLPVWCTAIFAATAIGANSIEQANYLTTPSGLTKRTIAVGFLVLMGFIILFLSHVLYRFRKHQAPLKRYSRTPILSSASTRLQVIVTVEGSILLLLAALLTGVPRWLSLPGFGLLVIVLTGLKEYALRRKRTPRP